MTGEGKRKNVLWRLAAVGCAVVALVASMQIPALADQPKSFVFRGLLPRPKGVSMDDFKGGGIGAAAVVATDPSNHLMYYAYYVAGEGRFHLVTYDTSKVMPKPLSDHAIAVPLPQTTSLTTYRMVMDSKRRRLIVLGGDAQIYVIDLRTGAEAASWSIQTELPGFFAEGATYSAADDRVYAVGEMVVNDLASNWNGERPQNATTVLALDAATGKRVWAVPAPVCQQPMNTYLVGTLIVRSVASQALYFPCAQSDLAQLASGIARIKIGRTGGSATQQQALLFPQDYFAVSGRYQSEYSGTGIHGAAAYDSGSDRIFVQSLSKITPGAWVFDARSAGWVGFVAAPSVLEYLGVDSTTGRFYAGALRGPFLVGDGRLTPTSQGEVYDKFFASRNPVADRGRVYVPWDLHTAGLSKTFGDTAWVVLEDRSLPSLSLEAPDYDALTQDIPESADTETTFAGGITGFGASFGWVGGWSGLLRSTPGVSSGETVRGLGTDSSLGGFGINDLGLQPGDRILRMARMESLDVRDAGSSATAQAIAPDSASLDEWDARKPTTEQTCDKTTTRMNVPTDNGDVCGRDTDPAKRGPVDSTLAAAAASLPPWPWPSTTCLDGSGNSDNPDPIDKSGGYAEVECAFDKQRTEGTSSFGQFKIGVEGLTVSIASSSFHGVARRDADLGAVSTGEARATGLSLSAAEGSVSIASVTQVVTTRAHGRPGTAKVEVLRRLDGIEIKPAGGAAQYVPVCVNDGCETILSQINRMFGETVKVEMPPATSFATKRGAFAGFQKTDGQYYNDLTVQNDDSRAVPALNLTFFADSEEKSRLVLQLAGVETTSIYTISSGGDFIDVPEPIIDNPLPGPIDPGSPVGPLPGGDGGGSTIVPHSAGEVVQGITAFLVRSPGEAAQFGLIVLLFACAIATIIRRKTIKDQLSEAGTL